MVMMKQPNDHLEKKKRKKVRVALKSVQVAGTATFLSRHIRQKNSFRITINTSNSSILWLFNSENKLDNKALKISEDACYS